MFQTFVNAWKIDDLRKKILFTLMVLVIFRLGAAIGVPFIDASVFAASISGSEGTIFNFLDMMTGGSFSQASLFALSVTPYINASIIINLLQVVIPALERWTQEGEEGRRKLNKLTRIATVVLSLGLSYIYFLVIRRENALLYKEGVGLVFSAIVIIMCFTAGAMLLMWLGEQVDSMGIGNGISILIFCGIVSGLPRAGQQIIAYLQYGAQRPSYYVLVPLIVLIFAVMFVMVVFMNGSERRIPIQYAKRVVGRKMYGGQNTYFPIKVSLTGVLPVIFASSILSVPGTIKDFFNVTGWFGDFLGWFSPNNWGYAIVYALLILAFNFFYVSIQYDPVKIANDLRKNSGGIPGIRPGEPTSQYFKRSLSKTTFVGGIFLIAVAIVPIIISITTGINISLGGTSLLIVVGVALEIQQTLDSYMLMRHHKGFLE